jgi:hypothetical protein
VQQKRDIQPPVCPDKKRRTGERCEVVTNTAATLKLSKTGANFPVAFHDRSPFGSGQFVAILLLSANATVGNAATAPPGMDMNSRRGM